MIMITLTEAVRWFRMRNFFQMNGMLTKIME
jgi:hypothetical protein